MATSVSLCPWHVRLFDNSRPVDWLLIYEVQAAKNYDRRKHIRASLEE
jgi:hypothetical protein